MQQSARNLNSISEEQSRSWPSNIFWEKVQIRRRLCIKNIHRPAGRLGTLFKITDSENSSSSDLHMLTVKLWWTRLQFFNVKEKYDFKKIQKQRSAALLWSNNKKRYGLGNPWHSVLWGGEKSFKRDIIWSQNSR